MEGRDVLERGIEWMCTLDGTGRGGVNGNWERHKEEGYKSEEWRGGRMRADTEGRG